MFSVPSQQSSMAWAYQQQRLHCRHSYPNDQHVQSYMQLHALRAASVIHSLSLTVYCTL